MPSLSSRAIGNDTARMVRNWKVSGLCRDERITKELRSLSSSYPQHTVSNWRLHCEGQGTFCNTLLAGMLTRADFAKDNCRTRLLSFELQWVTSARYRKYLTVNCNFLRIGIPKRLYFLQQEVKEYRQKLAHSIWL
jgi:hypothetical protein